MSFNKKPSDLDQLRNQDNEQPKKDNVLNEKLGEEKKN